MRRSYFQRSASGRAGGRPQRLRDLGRAVEVAGTWALPAVLFYWWKRSRAFFRRLAGSVDALREDADGIRAALTSGGAVPATPAAGREPGAVSEELRRATSALDDLAVEVRATGEQSRDGAATLSELVAAVSEYGVHLRSHTAVMRNLAATTGQLQEAAARLADALPGSPTRERPYGWQPRVGEPGTQPGAPETSRRPEERGAREARPPDVGEERWREPFTASELRWPDLPRTPGGYVAEPVDRLLDRAADALDLAERERDGLRERVLVIETRLAILTERRESDLQTRLAAQRDAQDRDARARHDATVALQEASRRVAGIVRDIEEEREKLLGLARELGAQLRLAVEPLGEGAASSPTSAFPTDEPRGERPPAERPDAPAIAPPVPWVPAAAGPSGAPSSQGEDAHRRDRPGVPPVWKVTPLRPRR